MRTLCAAAIAAILAIASPARADEPAYGKTQGAIPGILIGPKLNIFAIPPGFGLEAKLLENKLGLAFDLGIIPTTKAVDSGDSGEATLQWLDWSLAARYYPWAARFYVGLAAGGRTITAAAKNNQTGVEAKAEVSSTYIAPEIGWKFVWDAGFFMGIDLGYQIIVSNSSSFTLPRGVDPKDEKDVRDLSDQLGKTGLPILTLLQVGWLF